jgi:hypothetical protein
MVRTWNERFDYVRTLVREMERYLGSGPKMGRPRKKKRAKSR